MERLRLLITDLTEFGDLRCVAGWDIDRKIMIRPEPKPASFWPVDYCGKGRTFTHGHIVTLRAAPPNPSTNYPHRNEDRVVQGTPQVVKVLGPGDFISALRTVVTTAKIKAFAPPVEFANGRAFIRTGRNAPSLLGLSVDRSDVCFSEEMIKGKQRARCHIQTSRGNFINLSIAATDLRDTYRKQGLIGIERLFQSANKLHIRIGLARGFRAFPDRCYMQINGIFRI